MTRLSEVPRSRRSFSLLFLPMAFSDDSFSGDDDYAAIAETFDLDLMEATGSMEVAVRRAILSVVPAADRNKVEQLLEFFILRSDKYDSSPLLLALSMGRLEVCRALLAEGADPNRGSRKQSPLHLAAERGQDDVVQMLLDQTFHAGADTEKTDSHGCTPLMRACDMNHEAVARTLLAAGANARARERTLRSTPLLLAATKGHVGVVEALLEHDASLTNDTDRYHQSPIYVASGEGHVAVVRAFIVNPYTLNPRPQAFISSIKILSSPATRREQGLIWFDLIFAMTKAQPFVTICVPLLGPLGP